VGRNAHPKGPGGGGTPVGAIDPEKGGEVYFKGRLPIFKRKGRVWQKVFLFGEGSGCVGGDSISPWKRWLPPFPSGVPGSLGERGGKTILIKEGGGERRKRGGGFLLGGFLRGNMGGRQNKRKTPRCSLSQWEGVFFGGGESGLILKKIGGKHSFGKKKGVLKKKKRGSFQRREVFLWRFFWERNEIVMFPSFPGRKGSFKGKPCGRGVFLPALSLARKSPMGGTFPFCKKGFGKGSPGGGGFSPPGKLLIPLRSTVRSGRESYPSYFWEKTFGGNWGGGGGV